MMNLKFLDVDLMAESKRVGRKMGDLGRPEMFGSGRDISASGIKPLSRSERKDLADLETQAGGSAQERSTLWIHDQNGDPSCTSNAMLAMYEERFVAQFGRDSAVKMSAMSLYNRVGSPNSGSSIDGNIREMASRGALPLDTPENREKFKHVKAHNGYSRNPKGWEETGSQFLIDIDEMYEIPDGDPQAFASALLTGWSVIYARDGHCILAKRWMFNGNNEMAKYQNSWSLGWGDSGGIFTGGFGYDSDKKIARCSWGYAVRAIKKPLYLTLGLSLGA